MIETSLDKINFENVRVAIADPGKESLRALRSSMQEFGFRDIFIFNKGEALEGVLSTDSLDFVICDSQIPDTDLHDIIRRVRQQELGTNPFVMFLVMLPNAIKEIVDELINCGVDDMILKPISVGTLSQRILGMIENRKPFVVTHDYIGPNRRAADRPDAQAIAKIEVPNLLKIMTGDMYQQRQVHSFVKEGCKSLQVQSLERQAVQVSYQAECALGLLSVPDGGTGENQGLIRPHIDVMKTAAGNVLSAITTSKYATEDILFHTVCEVADRISEAKEPTDKDLEQLSKLAGIIRNTFTGRQRTLA